MGLITSVFKTKEKKMTRTIIKKENGLIAKEEKNEEVCYEYEPSNQ
jgi:hypothetical protein